ncbi:MAG TPA: beta-N-acetylhexosaminidase [archaeon]|nr:beta-N-acetylhexosaminidase [archaeon]
MKKTGCFLFLVLVITCFSGAAADQTALWKEGISLIPSPQEATLGGGDFVFVEGVSIVLNGPGSEADIFAKKDLTERLKTEWGVKITTGPTPKKTILLTRGSAPEKLGNQGYEIIVEKDKITIRANGEEGLFYGTRTLLQIIRKGRSGTYVKGMKITDWPDIPIRAAHYDTKHHQDKREYVEQFIRTLADYKINMLIWEWEDKFAYRSHPEIGAPGAFSMQEMQEFTRLARKYHIQLVPLVQGLGHVSYILKWPQYAHLREIPASNWEFCPLKDGSYELLFDLWDEAIEATPGSEFIHIGTDETYELGLGDECGCRAKAKEIGRYGLMQIFIKRCFDHLSGLGRRVISWGGEYRPDEQIKPPVGLIVSEFTDNLEIARLSRDAGYPAWVYDPNPGIEHLFLPYFYRLRDDGRRVEGCLENSCKRLTTAAVSGLFEGMVNTSWDDSGLHNQVWMMSFINSAEFSWSGKAPELDEFIDKYFRNYYGPKAKNLRELWGLLNDGAYYYMDTFERKVWHWGDVGKTHLPDLPREDAIEYDPYWNRKYKEMVERSREQLGKMEQVLDICRTNLKLGVKHSYDFEIFISLAELISHTARTYIALSELENAITEAHKQRFVSHQAAFAAMERAVGIIEDNLKEREQVFKALVATWEKTRLPKGLSTPEKEYFHNQDRARHFANRRPDMTYLIYDEQLLNLEGYLKKLQGYMAWYKQTFMQASGESGP